VAGGAIGAATGGKAGSGALLGGALGAVVGNLWTKRLQDKQEALDRASAGTGIEVARTADDQLRLNVPADFSLAIGSADIRPPMRSVLDEIGRNLDRSVYITVIGHTDSTGGDALSESLSVERAESVRSYLAARGVPASHVQVQGRGAREPVTSNSTDAGRAQNRRVEIFMVERAA
jgi:outer membrane protein OmpA-like peptidoglycan-associated protein